MEEAMGSTLRSDAVTVIDRKVARELLTWLLAAIVVPFVEVAIYLPEKGIVPLAITILLTEVLIGIALRARMDAEKVNWRDLANEIRTLCIKVREALML